MSTPLLTTILPTGDLFEALFVGGILPACEAACFRVVRSVLKLESQSVLKELQESIRKSDLVIADLTARNPHSLYAVGFAHALEKRVIISALYAEDVAVVDSAGTQNPLIHSGSPALLGTLLTAALKQDCFVTSNLSLPPAELLREPCDSPHEFLKLFGAILGEDGLRKLGRVRAEDATTFVLEGQELELALVQDLARHARSRGIRLKLL